MRLQRHVVARKNQHLVALPAEVRHHLALVPSAAVFWHVVRKGEATLTVSGRTRGGRPRLDADCSSCAKYRAEVARLAGLLRSSSVPTYNEAIRDGWAQAMRHYTRLDGDVQDLATRLDRIENLLAALVPPHRRARRQPRPSAPPPSPDSFAGEAATPGAAPPGGP